MAPDERRARLLEAAWTVFARQGYHGAGVADIVQAAGVARGTFYNYFESKRHAFDAVLADAMARVEASVLRIDVSRPIAPQVHENIRRIVASLAAMGDGARVLFTDAAGIDEDGRAALIAFYDAALARVVRALRTGQAMGLPVPADVATTAACLLGLVKEPVYQAVLHGHPLDAGAVADAVFVVARGAFGS
jgi:AcrR family transcriptional regulator